MRLWILSFLVLFGIAEFYQWTQKFTLPLPVYILGGAFLAIASNYNRLALPFLGQLNESAAFKDRTLPIISEVNQSELNPSAQTNTDNIKPNRSISFTIHKTAEEETERSS